MEEFALTALFVLGIVLGGVWNNPEAVRDLRKAVTKLTSRA